MFDEPAFEHLRVHTHIYLISPLDVSGDFPDRLARALDAPANSHHRVAAFQFRVKGVDEHEAARLAEPLPVSYTHLTLPTILRV